MPVGAGPDRSNGPLKSGGTSLSALEHRRFAGRRPRGAYWYEAYVAGLDPPGFTSEDIDCSVVNCRMSRAQEPPTLRVGVKWAF